MDNAGVSVAQFLKPFAEKRETGALEVKCGPYRGMLYIQSGMLVQAEYLGKFGISAAYDILAMEHSTMQWRDKATSEITTIAMDLVQLLEEVAAAKLLPPPPTSSVSLPASLEVDLMDEPEEKKDPVLSEKQKTSSDLLRQLYFSLEWLNSPEKRAPFEFENRDQTSYTVGSSEDCDFQLSHTGVQPLHFSLLVHADHVDIWDLGTDNATFLNDQLIDQAILTSGDIILAGEARLRFSLHLRRTGKISVPESENNKPDKPPVFQPAAQRIRGPITAGSIVKQQSQNPTLRKMIGQFFTKKGK